MLIFLENNYKNIKLVLLNHAHVLKLCLFRIVD
jgi:hypothetical protein